MKVGDNVRLLDDRKFNKQHIGKTFTVTLNAGDTFELVNSEGYIQHYYPSWGTDCYEIVDGLPYISGERLMEITGANEVQASARYNSGKVQLREIDPDFITGLGEVLTASRAKYEEFNWALPTKLTTPYESMMRHILAFQKGEDVDPDDGLHHLLKAATNIMFMYYHITNNPEYSDDRFFKKSKHEKSSK